MIVSMWRDRHSWFLGLHSADSAGEAYWLSPGGLRYLRKHTDYEPEVMHRVSFYTVEQLWATGHLRHLKDRPLPIGSFDEDFVPV